MFSTLGISPGKFWYILFTLTHFTFGTPVGTRSVLVVVLLVHQAAFGTLGPFLVILGTICTIVTFGTPVEFGTLRIGSVFSKLGIIPSEVWYIGGTFVYFTLYKL